MTPKERLQQALHDLNEINRALHIVNNATNKVASSQEEFDAAMEKGMKVLEEVEARRGAIDLVS